MSSKPGISFIGLGAMGFGMATNLVKQGYTVRGFDVWGPALYKFRGVGGQGAATPAEAVRNLPHCVCMVATMQQAQEVLFQGPSPAAKALPQGATLLLCSTVPAAYVQGLEEQLKKEGRGDIFLVDCPVSGGAGRAADGTLSIMASGSEAALAKARFLLQEMSDPAKLYMVKPEGSGQRGIGMGSNMKMCHQVLAANQILAASEAMGFAARMGLDLTKVGQEVIKSDAWSWMFENRLPRMLHPENKSIASAVTIILKDTSIITAQGRLLKFPTPMCSVAEQVYFASLSRGYGADDDSSLIRLYTEGAENVGKVQGEVTDEGAKVQLVIKLLKAIHLCSAAEAIRFGAHVGLDLDQLSELCNAAAGGSKLFETAGAVIIRNLRAGNGSRGWPADTVSLGDVTQDLQEAVDEAQRLKCPLFLGNQALNLLTMASRSVQSGSEAAEGSVVTNWCAIT
ncbi:hypothetical protein FH972_023451 [Carpinus fangiana]|uniref:3-hydroxyisobutyrate dehydrogenase n=1 Tax=Carpinus fangiana TaxID=176857 RepID=A0A5N6KV84_9ROSI|nr:hypothetical protein FH972_023451 [Carpinus fangiana]